MTETQNKIETVIPFPELPYYLTVKAVRDTERQIITIVVESKVHVNRVIEMPTRYQVSYVTDRPNAFREEVLQAVVRRYGLRREPVKYS